MFLKESHNHMSCLDECCLVWTCMFHISIESAQRRPCSHENVPPISFSSFRGTGMTLRGGLGKQSLGLIASRRLLCTNC